MTVRNQIRLIVYRIHEKGLEVLVNKPSERDEYWALFNAQLSSESLELLKSQSYIELEMADGVMAHSVAIEADWHELPHVRSMLKQDIHLLTDVIKSKVPEWENSAYVAAKEAIKKLMPQEYELLKELKEVILDRNTLKNI